jgi:hypothetical protein
MVGDIDAVVVRSLSKRELRLVGAEPTVNLLRHEEYREEEAQDAYAQDDSYPSQPLLPLFPFPSTAAMMMVVVMMVMMLGTMAVPRTVI